MLSKPGDIKEDVPPPNPISELDDAKKDAIESLTRQETILQHLMDLSSHTPESIDLPVPKGYDLQSLNGKHHQILVLASQGFKRKEIAKMSGVTEATVTVVTKSSLGRVHAAFIRSQILDSQLDVADGIKEFAPVALAIQQLMAVDPNTADGTRYSITRDILDRAGFKAPDKSVSLHGKLPSSYIGKAVGLLAKNGIKISSEGEDDASIS